MPAKPTSSRCILSLPSEREIGESLDAWQSSVPELARLIATGVPTLTALTRTGLAYVNQGRFETAVGLFRVALALDPGNPVAWTNWGVALDRAGNTPDAIACFLASLRLHKEQPDTWLLLGLARKRAGDLFGAEEAYRSAIEAEPGSAAAWQCLGSLKEELHQDDEAIACLLRFLKVGGVSAPVCATLGKLFYQNGRIAKAADAFHDAVLLDGENAHYRRMLSDCTFMKVVLEGGAIDQAISDFRQSVEVQGGDPQADLRKTLEAAIGIFSGFGPINAALRAGEEYLELWPGNEEITYLLQALRADAKVDGSPTGYLVKHFDAFAETFDSQLVGRLDYDVPAKIVSALQALLPADRALDVLDAGCGTGLCGPLLKPFARSLTGIDLSPKMIEMARKRGVYDQLDCGEIVARLDGLQGSFDLIVAADVVIYFGNLAALFASVARALRGQGLFAFSTEFHAGDGYRVLPSGRFAHASAYVLDVAKAFFEPMTCIETTIRLHANRRLAGNIFVFRRE
jgi:predicted TPR repeat methyltransferase/Flp pilus assembly protein TadD